MTIGISRGTLDGLLADARRTPQVERCGLLLGDATLISDWLPAANVHADPQRFFELDPVALIAAERRAREGAGPSVVGHYHFHPHGKATPSRADAEAALPDDRLWLIVSISGWSLWRSVAPGAGQHADQSRLLFGRFLELPINVSG